MLYVFNRYGRNCGKRKRFSVFGREFRVLHGGMRAFRPTTILWDGRALQMFCRKHPHPEMRQGPAGALTANSKIAAGNLKIYVVRPTTRLWENEQSFLGPSAGRCKHRPLQTFFDVSDAGHVVCNFQARPGR